jgi:hypothetical protein
LFLDSTYIYVACFSSNFVARVDMSGNIITLTSSITSPGGVAIDPFGTLYISQKIASSSTIYTIANANTGSYGAPVAYANAFSNPYHITYVPQQGLIYIPLYASSTDGVWTLPTNAYSVACAVTKPNNGNFTANCLSGYIPASKSCAYVCNSNYQLNGTAASCTGSVLRGGQTCIKYCQVYSSLNTGITSTGGTCVPGGFIAPGTTCTLALQSGYNLATGALAQSCPATGTTLSTANPTATATACTVNLPLNGLALQGSCSGGSLSSGQSCTTTCATGFNHNSTFTCNAGVLTTVANCVADCTFYSSLNTGFTVSGGSPACVLSSFMIPGSSCNLVLLPGYTLAGGSTLTQSCPLTGTTLSTSNPTATANPCSVSLPSNGLALEGACSTGTLASGQSCSTTCGTGFTSANTFTCLAGSLTSSASCQITCIASSDSLRNGLVHAWHFEDSSSNLIDEITNTALAQTSATGVTLQQAGVIGKGLVLSGQSNTYVYVPSSVLGTVETGNYKEEKKNEKIISTSTKSIDYFVVDCILIFFLVFFVVVSFILYR